MAAPMRADLDATAHWDAVKDLLVQTAIGPDVYEYGEVPGTNGNPGTLPPTHVLLTIERRYVPAINGRTSTSGWRVSCRYVGDTARNARDVGTWVTAALNEASVTVDGVRSTPITHESTTAVEPDDGMYSGLSQWTYAISL